MQLPFGSSAFRPAPARSFAVSSAPRSPSGVKGSVSASASCSPNRQARSSADRTRRVAARSARPEDPGTAEPLVADFAWPCIPEWTCVESAHVAAWSQRLIGNLRCSPPTAASSATSHPAELIANRTVPQESLGSRPSSVRWPCGPCAPSAKPRQGIGYTARSGGNAPGAAHAGQEGVPSSASSGRPGSGAGPASASADEAVDANASGATHATGPGLALDRMRISRLGR